MSLGFKLNHDFEWVAKTGGRGRGTCPLVPTPVLMASVNIQIITGGSMSSTGHLCLFTSFQMNLHDESYVMLCLLFAECMSWS